MLGFLMGLAFQSLSWIWILKELLFFKSGDLGRWLLKLGKYGSCKVCYAMFLLAIQVQSITLNP
jgi:hypothetical protein